MRMRPDGQKKFKSSIVQAKEMYQLVYCKEISVSIYCKEFNARIQGSGINGVNFVSPFLRIHISWTFKRVYLCPGSWFLQLL